MTSNNDDVPPLTDFFEMVHVADVIQQMVQLYYDEEMVSYIKLDYINAVYLTFFNLIYLFIY